MILNFITLVQPFAPILGMLGSLFILISMPYIEQKQVKTSLVHSCPLYWTFFGIFITFMYAEYQYTSFFSALGFTAIAYPTWCLVMMPIITQLYNTIFNGNSISIYRSVQCIYIIIIAVFFSFLFTNHVLVGNWYLLLITFTTTFIVQQCLLQSNSSSTFEEKSNTKYPEETALIQKEIANFKVPDGDILAFVNGAFQSIFAIYFDYGQEFYSVYPRMRLSLPFNKENVNLIIIICHFIPGLSTDMLRVIKVKTSMLVSIDLFGWSPIALILTSPCLTMLYENLFLLRQIIALMNKLHSSFNTMIDFNRFGPSYQGGTQYQLSVFAKLIALIPNINLEPNLLYQLISYVAMPFKLPLDIVTNSRPINFLWFLGFLVSKGNFYLKVSRNATTIGFEIIPKMTIVLSDNEQNINLFNMIINYLHSIGITSAHISPNTKIVENGTTYTSLVLEVIGHNNILNILLPFLNTYQNLLFSLSDCLPWLNWVNRMIQCKGHLTYLGMRSLLLYYVHVYGGNAAQLEYLELFLSRLNNVASGHYYIKITNTGYRVCFPSYIKAAGIRDKLFTINDHANDALQSAIKYRDTSIINYLKDHKVWFE